MSITRDFVACYQSFTSSRKRRVTFEFYCSVGEVWKSIAPADQYLAFWKFSIGRNLPLPKNIMEPTKDEKSKNSTEATKIESPNEISSETTTYEQALSTNEREIVSNEPKNENSSPHSVVAQEDAEYPQNADETLQCSSSGAVPKTSQSTTKSSEAAIIFTSSRSNNKLCSSVSQSENNSNIRISEYVQQPKCSHQSEDNAEAIFSEWIEEFGKILAWPAGEPCEVLLQFMETIEDLGFSFDSMFSSHEESINEEFAGWLQLFSLETGVPVEVLTSCAQPASISDQSTKCSLKAISEETSFVEENEEKCRVPDALKEANKCMYEKSQFLGREVKNVKEKLIFIRKVRKNISEFRNPVKLHEDTISKIRALVERKRRVLEFKKNLKELHQIEEESSYCAINNVLRASMGRLDSELQRSLQGMETKGVRTSELDLHVEKQSLNSEDSLSAENLPDVKSKPISLDSHETDLETDLSVRGVEKVSPDLIPYNEQSPKCSEQPENSESAAVIEERREEDIKLKDLEESNKYILEGLKLSKERRKIISTLKVLFRDIFCNMLKLQRGHRKTHESVTREFSVTERCDLTLQTKKLTTQFNELLKTEMQISERILKVNTLMQELWIKVFLQIKDNRISEVRVSTLSYRIWNR